MSDSLSVRDHWNTVYATKNWRSVSWYLPHLDASLALIARLELPQRARVIDVGGGASTFVDDLLERYRMTVLDLSSTALDLAHRRLGSRAEAVEWRVGNILEAALPATAYDLWHDRAVLHFLTDASDALRYAEAAAHALRPGGHLVVAGFAPDGPARCSGLPVARRSLAQLVDLFDGHFDLRTSEALRHQTPDGSQQAFLLGHWQRR
jgi:SAM-dependent methyltransferase